MQHRTSRIVWNVGRSGILLRGTVLQPGGCVELSPEELQRYRHLPNLSHTPPKSMPTPQPLRVAPDVPATVVSDAQATPGSSATIAAKAKKARRSKRRGD